MNHSETQYGQPKQEREHNGFEIERRIKPLVDFYVSDLAGTEEFADALPRILSAMEQRLLTAFPEAAEALKEFADDLSSDSFVDADDFVDRFSKRLGSILAAQYRLEDLEQKLRARQVEEHGLHELSRLLTYEVSNGAVYLHAAMVFTDSASDLKAQFREGMQRLATQMEHDPALARVAKIYARSHLVRSQRLMESLGFNYTPGETNQVEMTRADLLRIYKKQ